MRHKLNLVHLLAIANAVLLLAAVGVGWDMTRRYNELMLGYEVRSAQKIADAGVSDLAWREYAQLVADIGRHIAQSPALRQMLTERDAAAVKDGLADEFGRGAISSGQVRVLGLSLYDASMNLIGEAWHENAAAIPPAVRAAVVDREGTDRLKILLRVWQDGDEPRLSVFVPVGGLRLAGYIGVHADPIHALATLDQRLGMAVEVLAIPNGRLLLSPDSFKVPAAAEVRESILLVHAPDGHTIARLRVRQDITDLTSSLRATALWSLGIFLLCCGAIAAGSVVAAALFLARVRQRETDAQLEIDQRQREKMDSNATALLARRDAEVARRAELLRLADSFEASVKSVAQFVFSAAAETTANAEALAVVAERTSTLSGAANGASDHAFANVQSVSTASRELASAITEITGQVTQSNDMVSKAAAEANDTIAAMQGLDQAAKQIAKVVDLIKAIADQTNLLGLNATIEAARAGGAGKGFAVVAGEVQLLATQTAKATEDIATQIKAIQSSSRHAATSIERVGQTIDEIKTIAANVAAAVQQQSLATLAIKNSVERAVAGAQDVAGNIAGVDQAASETNHVAEKVLTTSRLLARQADSLHEEVERFLSTVRA